MFCFADSGNPKSQPEESSEAVRVRGGGALLLWLRQIGIML